MINVYSRTPDWLFADLKAALETAGAVPSETPVEGAQCWICIRTSEAALSPDLSRTIVQVHDMGDHDVGLLNGAGAVLFTHPLQLYLSQQRGFSGRYRVLPIGARRAVQSAIALPPKPTVGYFTGETGSRSKRSEMFAEAVAIARQSLSFDVLMIGRWLERIAGTGTWHDRAAGPLDYQSVDVLVTCSPSPGIPLSVYEASAVGIPVVTTPRWFPKPDWPNIFTGDSAEDLAQHIVAILQNRASYFVRRADNAVLPYAFDSWVSEQVALARNIELS